MTLRFQRTVSATKRLASSADGIKFYVYLFDCNNDRCGSIQFATGPHTSATGKLELERVNEWNKTKRWARAYFGGAVLTPIGTEIVDRYRAMQASAQLAADAELRVIEALARDGGGE